MSWFVAYTKSRCELKASAFFQNIGIMSYVPVFEEKREWSDRTKKVKTPAISGYVFFEIEELDYSIINLNPYLRNVIRRYGKAVEIRDDEIEAMKSCLKLYTDEINFKAGDLVKVISGVFKNKRGLIDRVDGSYITLLVNSIKIKLSLNKTKLTPA